jgi:hypothetical protein
MASRDEDSGSLTNRLMSRSETGLHRQSVQGGGEVYSGPTASRALKAIGARAMTMDDTIFVDEGFDVNKAEDAALYAHESHHRDESGGSDQHGARDAEEVHARAIERMVLHRMDAGEGLGDILRDVQNGVIPRSSGEADSMAQRSASSPAGATGKGGGSELDDGDAMKAYNDMVAAGKDHKTIVRELVKYCVETITRQEEEHHFRKTELDFF